MIGLHGALRAPIRDINHLRGLEDHWPLGRTLRIMGKAKGFRAEMSPRPTRF